MSAKITPEHTRRAGIVYVRRSTASQARGNLESQRRQHALADHARALGLRDVEVIDQDLGQFSRPSWHPIMLIGVRW